MSVKLYVIDPNDGSDEEDRRVLVYAKNMGEARKYCWEHLHDSYDYYDKHGQVVWGWRQLDCARVTYLGHTPPPVLEATPTKASDEVYRLFGFGLIGEYHCDLCHLRAFGIDRYTVCDNCGLCPECAIKDGDGSYQCEACGYPGDAV